MLPKTWYGRKGPQKQKKSASPKNKNSASPKQKKSVPLKRKKSETGKRKKMEPPVIEEVSPVREKISDALAIVPVVKEVSKALVIVPAVKHREEEVPYRVELPMEEEETKKVSKEERNEKDDEEEGHNEEDNTVGDEDEFEPMQPLKLYFPNNEYVKPLKIITHCHIKECVDTLEEVLKLDELSWFLEHPQFRHFFHMPRERTHKIMGMWMLLLRTACVEKQREAWFVMNSVPIRYFLKEYALLSGLHCHAYPEGYKSFGNSKLVDKHFKKEKVTYAALK